MPPPIPPSKFYPIAYANEKNINKISVVDLDLLESEFICRFPLLHFYRKWLLVINIVKKYFFSFLNVGLSFTLGLP